MRVEASMRLASNADVPAMSIDEVVRIVQDIELRYLKWVAGMSKVRAPDGLDLVLPATVSKRSPMQP